MEQIKTVISDLQNDTIKVMQCMSRITMSQRLTDKSIDDYLFSSYNDYVDEDSEIVDFDFALSMMKRDEFIAFNIEKNDDICMDIDPKKFRIND